jgi:uncharacterized membrane protein
MSGPPRDPIATQYAEAIGKVQFSLSEVVAATQKADEIRAAKDGMEALRVAAGAAQRAFHEARELAEKAILLDGAEAREAELRARLDDLQARLAEHNAVDGDTKETP